MNMNDTMDDALINSLKLSALGLSRAQILQTSVDEILERTKMSLESNQRSLTQSQLFSLREKLVETKKLLETQEGMILFEKKAKKRMDADTVRLFHDMRS